MEIIAIIPIHKVISIAQTYSFISPYNVQEDYLNDAKQQEVRAPLQLNLHEGSTESNILNNAYDPLSKFRTQFLRFEGGHKGNSGLKCREWHIVGHKAAQGVPNILKIAKSCSISVK